MRARLMAAGLVEGRAVAGTLAAAALVSLLLAAPTVAAARDRARPGDAHPSGLTLRLLSLRSTYSLRNDGARLRKKIDDARRAEAAEDAAVARLHSRWQIRYIVVADSLGRSGRFASPRLDSRRRDGADAQIGRPELVDYQARLPPESDFWTSRPSSGHL